MCILEISNHFKNIWWGNVSGNDSPPPVHELMNVEQELFSFVESNAIPFIVDSTISERYEYKNMVIVVTEIESETQSV